MTTKPLIIANLKMNPRTQKEAEMLYKGIGSFAKNFKKSEIVVCAPYPYLSSLSKIKNSLKLGVQDVHEEKEGAYTGGVSASMAKSVGAKYAIVGHSERRRAGDADEVISKKLLQTIKSGLIPVLCIGESVRDEKGDYHLVVKQQLIGSLAGFPKAQLKTLVIAYEPVWAIGKSAVREATPEESREMAIFIKKVLSDTYGANTAEKVRIIYGGSVNTENAESFLQHGGVEGVLVGRESLNAKKFGKIIGLAQMSK